MRLLATLVFFVVRGKSLFLVLLLPPSLQVSPGLENRILEKNKQERQLFLSSAASILSWWSPVAMKTKIWLPAWNWERKTIGKNFNILVNYPTRMKEQLLLLQSVWETWDGSSGNRKQGPCHYHISTLRYMEYENERAITGAGYKGSITLEEKLFLI